jgi:IS5 family transposase
MKSRSKQRTLAMMTGFERYTKKTRRAIFLEEMEQVVPWAKLCALIEPHYPKPGNGRRPKELEKMLRIYFLQQWFNLADPAVEEALYDSATLRQFAGIDLGAEPVPDETTVCKFRHLLEEHNLGEEILGTVNLHLQAKGVRITTGTIVDATIIHARAQFDQNRDQSRDPEMYQTRKGKQWYFGMTAHVGVDSKTKIIHTAVATAANISDVAILPDLLHGEETRVWGDIDVRYDRSGAASGRAGERCGERLEWRLAVRYQDEIVSPLCETLRVDCADAARGAGDSPGNKQHHHERGCSHHD